MALLIMLLNLQAKYQEAVVQRDENKRYSRPLCSSNN
jgi:hypothetical protein